MRKHIQNNNEGANHGVTNVVAYQRFEQCTFNPLEKMVELYERMLKEKDEMIARLEQLIKAQ